MGNQIKTFFTFCFISYLSMQLEGDAGPYNLNKKHSCRVPTNPLLLKISVFNFDRLFNNFYFHYYFTESEEQDLVCVLV